MKLPILLTIWLVLVPGAYAPVPMPAEVMQTARASPRLLLPSGWSVSGVDGLLLDVINERETGSWKKKSCPPGYHGEQGPYQIRPSTVQSQLKWRPDPRIMAQVLCDSPAARIVAAEIMKNCWKAWGNWQKHAFPGLRCWNGGPKTNKKWRGKAYWYAKQVASNYAEQKLKGMK